MRADGREKGLFKQLCHWNVQITASNAVQSNPPAPGTTFTILQQHIPEFCF